MAKASKKEKAALEKKFEEEERALKEEERLQEEQKEKEKEEKERKRKEAEEAEKKRIEEEKDVFQATNNPFESLESISDKKMAKVFRLNCFPQIPFFLILLSISSHQKLFSWLTTPLINSSSLPLE